MKYGVFVMTGNDEEGMKSRTLFFFPWEFSKRNLLIVRRALIVSDAGTIIFKAVSAVKLSVAI